MSDSPNEFNDLMQRLRQGDEGAARELLDSYGDHILRVVRRRLNKKMRSKFDSVDFVQAVWASFFAKVHGNAAFDQPEKLLAYLVNMAQNKVIDAVRQRLKTQKHNLNREHALDGSVAPQAAGVAARDPTPSQVAVANDEWCRLLADLPACYQSMLVLLREGHTQKDVARELGVNEKTVRRWLEKLNEEPIP
jgi:RNA polymerase sigma-70 factor (ECF subfamily)